MGLSRQLYLIVKKIAKRALIIDGSELDLNNNNISRSAVRRSRISARSKIAGQTQEDLQIAPSLVIHWDGKLLSDLTRQATVDRMPVSISGVGTQQWLSVPKLHAVQEQSKIRLRFFDNPIPIETKRKMKVDLKIRVGPLEPSKRFPAHSANL